MLTAKLGSVLSNRRVLFIVLGALVASGILAAQAASMSAELASKSSTIELQNQEIERYLATIAAQRAEVEAKTVQLEQLNLQIASKEQEIAASSEQAARLGDEVEDLQLQAAELQIDIGLLQSKIRSDEQYITDLTRQLAETQAETRIVRISHYGLAVEDNSGVVFPIEVDIISAGTGSVSVDVSNAKYEAAFQDAVRTAAVAASKYTGVPISDKNIVVRFLGDHEGDPVRVDGSSAGALIACLISAGLTDRQVNTKVLVTGTIDPDGTIGTVGSIEDKTEAAADFGANILLVPAKQEFDSNRIVIVGVSDIEDAMRYLLTSK